MLEPCNAKVLRTVLRGLGASNRAWLLGDSPSRFSFHRHFAAIHHNSHDTYMTPRFRAQRKIQMVMVSFQQACVGEAGALALAPRGHNSGTFFNPKIGPLAFFFHAVSG